jgi:hypothetical protein
LPIVFVALALGACLAACGRTGSERRPDAGAAERSSSTATEIGSDAESELAAARQELARLREDSAAETARQSERIRELESELASATDERVEREKKWLAYAQGMSKLGAIAGAPPPPANPDPVLERAVASSALTALPELSTSAALDDAAVASAATKRDAASAKTDAPAPKLETPAPKPEPPAPKPEPPAPKPEPPTPKHGGADPALAAIEKRDRDAFVALRSLFMIEQVGGFDLLESGTLHEASTGPVVLRVLDDRGRPLGAIYAERMRLEGSRAARTLTIVLEDGHERRGGVRTPFPEVPQRDTSADASGIPRGPSVPHTARRIVLPDVDPEPWIAALPELFAAEAKEPPPNDGLWNLEDVRAGLNVLLRQDASAGYYRVQSLSGVQGDTLREVQVDALDRDGRLERKLFADRMRCLASDRGVMIQLESGAQMRGDEKTPFQDGRYRIFLPRADIGEWQKTGVPGLSPAPGAKGRAASR